jgi:hypothetical protein
MFKDYPPAAALFHYFVVFTQFSEGRTYYAQALLLIASVLALARWAAARDAVVYALVVVAGLMLLEAIGLGFATVETDHLVGAVFGAAVGAFAVRDPSDRRSVLALVPVLFCLPLIKPIGVFLGLAAAAVMALDVLRANFLGRAASSAGRDRLAWTFTCALLLAAPVIAHQSWELRTSMLQFRRTFTVTVTREGLRALVAPSARTPLQQRIAANFRNAWRQASIGRFGNGMTDGEGRWLGPDNQLAPRTGPHLLACLGLVSLVAVVLAGDASRNSQIAVHAALAGGCVAYLALLLYVYLHAFGEYEATRVIAFGRYASTWFLGWALAIVASLGDAARGRGWRRAAAALILVSIAAWGTARAAPVENPDAQRIVAQRRATRALTRRVQRVVPPLSSTYVIWQGSTGFPFFLAGYELTPRRTNLFCWSVGERYYEQDLWTCPLALEEFSRVLDTFEYVFIGHADDRFWTTYHPLFEEGSSAANRAAILFKVTRRGTAPKLRRVDTTRPPPAANGTSAVQPLSPFAQGSAGGVP